MIDSADAVVLAAIAAAWVLAWQLFLAAVQQLQAVFKQRELRQIAQRKRKQRDEKRHSCLSDRPVDQRVVDVTRSSKSVAKLQEGFARGEYSVQQLVAAYAHRCCTEGRQLQAVTEEFYDEAYARAGELDAEAEAADVSELIRQRPLWGVPISVKDQIDQDGADSTCGVAARCFKPRKDGYVVKSLRRAGAIPFVRSNVPQLLMLPESENFVWGVAKNPWDPKRTPGGSSGGEGVLVALGCSAIGLGTDIGGSIRIPASFCGVFGFKPTPSRTTARGQSVPRLNDRSGQIAIPTTAGPLGRCTDDLVLVLKTWWDQGMFQEDSRVPPLPFDSQTYLEGGARGKPLRVGFFTTDGWFEPHTASVRAVEETVRALEQAGHECQKIGFPEGYNGADVARLYYRLLGAEGNMVGFMQGLEGEALWGSYRSLYALANVPNFVRGIAKVALWLTGQRRKMVLLQNTKYGGLDVREYWDTIADLKLFTQAWDYHIKALGIDVVIYPATPLPAFPHGVAKDITPCLTYTFLANLLQWPAGVVPITVIQPHEARYDVASLPRFQQDSMAQLAAKVMENSAGLPVGVQVMSRGYQDELCLHTMRVIEDLMPFRHQPPTANAI